MNIGVIIAGGSGQRMHQEIPKQFMNVNDKPVIVYTLEAFERHPDIDEIGVVCLDGWHEGCIETFRSLGEVHTHPAAKDENGGYPYMHRNAFPPSPCCGKARLQIR